MDGVTKTYSYNSQNELTTAMDGGSAGNAGAVTMYQYNVDGVRTQQSTAGIATDYLVDHNRDYAQVLVESENGTAIVQYTYGDDLISQERGGNTSTYLYDGLGSARGLSNDSGSLANTYDYTAFGEVLNQTGSTLNNYLFTGEQFDSQLNQYYLRARYYNQAIGRLNSMDTYQGRMAEPVTLHKYLYVHADPVNNIDPSGNITLSQALTAINVVGRLTATATQVPRLGFTFLRNSAGHVVGIAAVTCVASYAATNFGISMPASQFNGCEGNGHRGRWQAQGGGLQKSQGWAQSTPLTLTQGLALLDTLEASLTRRERSDRSIALDMARTYARRLASAGGISAVNFGGSKSFPTRSQSASAPRIDLEINSGHAFTNE